MRHIGEIKEVWFGGYGSITFEPFAWAQHLCATKWVKDTSSTLRFMEEVLYLKFPPQKSFHALAYCGPKFLLEPIFAFKHSWFPLTNSNC